MLSITAEWDTTKLPAYAERLHATVHQTVREQSLLMAQFAKDTVLKETGSLADTIDAEPLLDGEDGLIEWQVSAGNVEGGYKGGGKLGLHKEGAPVDYAEAQEYGGHGEHKPYMTPASEQGFVSLVAALSKNLGELR